MNTFTRTGNQNLLNAEKFEDFGKLLALALGATVEQLNGGELTVKDIFTQVHGTMRGPYIDLRRNGKSHKEAVKETNRQAERPNRPAAYATGGW